MRGSYFALTFRRMDILFASIAGTLLALLLTSGTMAKKFSSVIFSSARRACKMDYPVNPIANEKNKTEAGKRALN